jgi:hypothetical protein
MHAPNESKLRLDALRAGVVLLIAAAVLPGTVLAQWESFPTVRLGVEGNDNPRLGQWVPGPGGGAPDPLDGHIATRTLLDARLDVTNTGPSGSFSIAPRVVVDAQQDDVDEDLEREDAYLTVRGVRRGLRTETRMDASLSRESILTSELAGTDFSDPESGIEEPIDTDTGVLVSLDQHRKRLSLGPSVEFEVSQRGSVALELDHLDVDYTGPQLAGRTDFTDTGMVFGYNRATSLRGEAAVRLLVSKFSADLTDNDTDTVGIEGAYQTELNDLWSIDAFVGMEQSTFDFLDGGRRVSGDDTNFTFGVGLDMRSERGTLSFDIGHSVGPNGSGFLSTRNDMRGFYRWRITERMRGVLGVTHSRTEALDANLNQRDYTRLNFDIEWELSNQWGLNAGFSALDQEFSATTASNGQANVMSFGAVYRGLRRPSTGPR